MDKPKAIERMRKWATQRYALWDCSPIDDAKAILAYLDSIPDDAVCVVWPKELTRERLEEAADALAVSDWRDLSDALRALAAIAPVRKKRMVNLWMCRHISKDPIGKPVDWVGEEELGWRKVAGPIEIED